MSILLTGPMAVVAPLLDPVPEANEVTPGWIYAALFVALFAATILLWLSMRKQLKKVRFDEGNDPVEDDSTVPPADDAR